MQREKRTLTRLSVRYKMGLMKKELSEPVEKKKKLTDKEKVFYSPDLGECIKAPDNQSAKKIINNKL